MKNAPAHVAIALDACSRWLPPGAPPPEIAAVAAACVRAAAALARAAVQRGVRYLTLCGEADPDERGRADVRELSASIAAALRRDQSRLLAPGVRVRVLEAAFAGPLRQALRELGAASEVATDGPERLQLSVALGLGGRADLVRAAQRLARQVAAGVLRPEEIDPERVRAELMTGTLPDPDLILCTGGAQRLPAVLTFESAYAELSFTDVTWPALGAADLGRALDDFGNRERRFGKTGEQIRGQTGSGGVA